VECSSEGVLELSEQETTLDADEMRLNLVLGPCYTDKLSMLLINHLKIKIMNSNMFNTVCHVMMHLERMTKILKNFIFSIILPIKIRAFPDGTLF